LHVHHKQYIKGRDVWDYEREQLACLCEICHENQHELEVKFQDLLSRIPIDGPCNKDDICYLLAGFLGLEVSLDHAYQKELFSHGVDASHFWSKTR
jgi:hypothetical protein